MLKQQHVTPFTLSIRYEFYGSGSIRGGARHFDVGGPLEGPVLQQGELSMVCVL